MAGGGTDDSVAWMVTKTTLSSRAIPIPKPWRSVGGKLEPLLLSWDISPPVHVGSSFSFLSLLVDILLLLFMPKKADPKGQSLRFHTTIVRLVVVVVVVKTLGRGFCAQSFENSSQTKK